MISGTSQSKRVILIASSLSPEIGSSTFRVFQFANLLPELGWKPIVLYSTPIDLAYSEDFQELENKGVELIDLSPDSTRILSPQDYSVANSFSNRLKYNLLKPLLVPDVTRGFWITIRDAALRHVKRYRPSIILSHSPAASTHLLAEYLSKTLQIPWIADMGDCSFDEKIKKNTLVSKIASRAWIRSEKSIYSRASIVFHRNPTHLRLARKIHVKQSRKCKLLEDGIIPVTDNIEVPEHFHKLNPGSFKITAAIDESAIDAFSTAFGKILKDDYRIALNVIATSPIVTKAIKTRLGNYFSFFFINEHYHHAIPELHNTDLFICSDNGGEHRNIAQNRVLKQILAFNKPTIVLEPSFSSYLLLKKHPQIVSLPSEKKDDLYRILVQQINNQVQSVSEEEHKSVPVNSWHQTVSRLSNQMDQIAPAEIKSPQTSLNLAGNHPTDKPLATIVITTKNRIEELRAAVRSALNQSVPVEVLVFDDGSTDGTSEIIQSEFPTVRLIREENSRGLIVRRNQSAKLAQAPIVISIDDDAAFPSSKTVEQTLAEFSEPEIGAVAIPFLNFNQDLIIRQQAPSADEIYITRSYIGTAHAIRRDLFLALGGYREYLFHQGEEGDYTVRMLNAGYYVRVGTADPIHHFESPRRDFRRIDLYGRRNDILFVWYNVPMPFFILHLLATTLNGVRTGIRTGRLIRMCQGLLKGYRDLFNQFSMRKPVNRAAYLLYRSLQPEKFQSLSEVKKDIPTCIPIEKLQQIQQ